MEMVVSHSYLHSVITCVGASELRDAWAKIQKRNLDWLDGFFQPSIMIMVSDFSELSQTNVSLSTFDYYSPINDPDFKIKCQPKAFDSLMCQVEIK